MTKENWERLERMIEKIIADCMGSALYNGLESYLNGRTLTFQYVNGYGSNFHFDGPTAGISRLSQKSVMVGLTRHLPKIEY